MSLTSALDQYGFVGLVSFGLTYIVCSVYGRQTGKELTSPQKMVIQGVFAFVLLFVPIEFQNVFLEQLKAAVGIVGASSALWQIVKAL